ncbi:MAG TPA: alkaline phosphatase family protein, partial [Candidatus Izemoplasmatales bacterium]|nr:alkaline phosphatase family protein [Candidatus Izemoplasmatales bacterium]
TTVAATTTVLTGKPPIQTAWIGWMQYVREVERNIVFFKNNDYYDEKKFMDYPISDTYVPVTYIYEILKKQNPDLNVREIFPAFREPEHDTFLKQAQSLVEEFEKPGRHFTYVYWDKLDWYMHEYGPSSQRASDTLALVDEGYAYLKQNIPPDSIVIVIADHGQVDVKPIKLYEYDKLWNTLSQLPSIESRAATFWVKDGKKKEFENEFLTNFRDKYILYKTEEVLAMNLFGYGEMHPRFRNFLGDYMAIAIDDAYFVFHPTDFYMKGQHAGLTAEEMQVPLIIYGKQ